MESDKDEILSIHNSWMDAERRGDLEEMLKLCSSDIRFYPPGHEPVQGIHRVREFLQASGGSIKNIDISNIHVEIGGSLAYKTCTFITSFQPAPEFAIKTIRGSHLWVLRRVESQWRIIIIAWSTS